MLDFAFTLLIITTAVQAVSDNEARTTVVPTETQIWTPRKPYAQPVIFEQQPLSNLSDAYAFGKLFERQTSLQCSSSSGQGYTCPGNSSCCNALATPGCCDAGQQCMMANGVQTCCPIDEGYITCGGTTCVCMSSGGFCCEQPGTACAGLSQCCKNGGCCDMYSEECCGDVCCTGNSKCCGGSVCCNLGYVCESEKRCVPSATSLAATTVVQTVAASGVGALGVDSLIVLKVLVFGYGMIMVF